jgi:cysteinyl-tRNA synthetase
LQGFRGDQAPSGEPTTKPKPAASLVWNPTDVQSTTPVGFTLEGSPGEKITALIERRKAAKAVRDFATADRIRDELRSQGIELIDRPGGSTEWLRR